MNVQRISRGCNFPEPSHTLLTNQQGLYVFQSESAAGMNGRRSSIGHNSSAAVKKPSYSQSPHLSWTLPQKRSNQSPTSERFRDLEAHLRSSSRICSAKRLKGPTTTPLPDPPSSLNPTNTTGLSRPTLDSFNSETVSPERVAPAEFPGDQLDPDRPKALRSPFEYTQRLVTSHVDPDAKKDIQRLDANELVPSEKSSRYIYYAPTNCYNKPYQAFGVHRNVPNRQLSYGEPCREVAPRCLHKTKGSRELRHEAERNAEDYNLEMYSDSTLDASAARPDHCEGTWSKPRLWLDLSEQEDTIQEAVSIMKQMREYKTQLPKFYAEYGTARSHNQNKPIKASNGLYTESPTSDQPLRNNDARLPRSRPRYTLPRYTASDPSILTVHGRSWYRICRRRLEI